MRVLDKCLRLLHPFTPYVTEELWGHLKETSISKGTEYEAEDGWAEALIIAQWPRSKEQENWEKDAVSTFNSGTIEHTRAFRSLKTDLNIPVNQKTGGTIVVTKKMMATINSQKKFITALGAIKDLEILENVPDAEEYQSYRSLSIPTTGSIVFLKTEDLITQEEMREKLQKELITTQSQIKRLEGLLASDFAKKAPAQVVEKEQSKLDSYKQTGQKIKEQLDAL